MEIETQQSLTSLYHASLPVLQHYEVWELPPFPSLHASNYKQQFCNRKLEQNHHSSNLTFSFHKHSSVHSPISTQGSRALVLLHAGVAELNRSSSFSTVMLNVSDAVQVAYQPPYKIWVSSSSTPHTIYAQLSLYTSYSNNSSPIPFLLHAGAQVMCKTSENIFHSSRSPGPGIIDKSPSAARGNPL
jgi:hypothetical protein